MRTRKINSCSHSYYASDFANEMMGCDKSDFFLSRRGSVADIAREVETVLTERGYKVFVQDYDIPITANFVAAIHEGLKKSRDLVVLFTRDYEGAYWTRKEFTSFEAQRAQSSEERKIVILRCEDTKLLGLFGPNVYQDLVGVDDPTERCRRILSAAEGQSQLLRAPPRPFVGPPPRIAGFIGRVEELDRLDAILVQDKPAAVTQAIGRAAVRGMGGVGKTSLAVEYAHRFRNLYAGVWWCPAETRAGLLSSLAALAVELGAAGDETLMEVAAMAGLRKLAEQRSTWLLIYDNVPSPEEIKDLLPASGARTLITSRFSDWSGWAEEVAIDVLPIDEAVALLQNRAKREDEIGAQKLAEALGRLPLALDHAAATCRRTQMCFADYAVRVANLLATAPRGSSYPRSVAVTFDLAIAEATTRCPAAELLMAFLGKCAPERIPMMLVEGAFGDETERLEALAALGEVSLLKHDPFENGAPAVTVHRLVQMVARARAAEKGMAGFAVDRLIAQLAATYPNDSARGPQAWPLCAQLTPHLLALRDMDDQERSSPVVWTDLLQRAGNYFHWRAAYSHAAPLLREAVSTSEKAFGPRHPQTADALIDLAGMLQDQGSPAEARQIMERALAIHQTVSGHKHPKTATILNNLAVLLRDEGALREAMPLVKQALSIREQVLGAEHPQTASSLTTLGLLHQAEGDFAAAQPLLERSLLIREKELGEDHPDTAHSLHNLARLLHARGELSEALPLFWRALAVDERVLGLEHPNTNRVRRNLALALLAIGQPNEAVGFGETALAAHDKVLGPEHAWTVDSARTTANGLDAMGRVDEATALLVRYGLLAR